MRLIMLAIALVATAICVQPAAAQVGVTEPMRSPITSSRGNTFRQGTVYADAYRIYVEPVLGISGGVVVTYTTSAGAVLLPQSRVLRFPKEELHYNAVMWAGVQPGTETVTATITWPDGVGAVTGCFYPAGSAAVTYNVTITP